MKEDIKCIYNTIKKLKSVDGLDDIASDMNKLNLKINELDTMARINPYEVLKTRKELGSLNKKIENKYSKITGTPVYFKCTFENNPQKEAENTLSTLGLLASEKICGHYGIEYENIDRCNSTIGVFKDVLDNASVKINKMKIDLNK